MAYIHHFIIFIFYIEIDKLSIPKEVYINIYLNLDSIYAYRLSQTCKL